MLGGMVISSRGAQGKTAVTTLKGTLIDQACLMGVLTALYEMGYTLLDVKRLPDPVIPFAETGEATGQRPAA